MAYWRGEKRAVQTVCEVVFVLIFNSHACPLEEGGRGENQCRVKLYDINGLGRYTFFMLHQFGFCSGELINSHSSHKAEVYIYMRYLGTMHYSVNRH